MGTISRITTFSAGSVLTAAQLNNEFDNILATANGNLNAANLGVTAGIAAASKALVLDASRDLDDSTGGNQIRNLALAGTLSVTGNADFDGVTNLDAVDIDGAVQLDSTLTVGANDQGYDVILYGDTASANLTWDTSVDDLIWNGAARAVIPDSQLVLGSTAVTTTGAEINLIDGGTSRGTTAVASGDGILINDAGTMRMTNVDTVSTYFSSHSVGGGNIVTVGALNSGSITSGFGNIDTGSSTITTTGALAAGATTIGGTLDFNSGTIDLSTQTVDVTLNAAVDALNFDSNTLSIDASNNRVGIGLAAPADFLHIKSGTGTNQIHLDASGGTGGAANLILNSHRAGSSGGQTGGSVVFFNNADGEAASTAKSYASIIGLVNNDPNRGSLAFYTANDADAVERMRIDNSGNVGVGTAAPVAYTKLDVAGNVRGGLIGRQASLSDGDTTPSVDGMTFVMTANTSSTTITNFDDGEQGQILTIYFGDANTTVNRDNIYMGGSATFTGSARDILTLVSIGGDKWVEISRSVNG